MFIFAPMRSKKGMMRLSARHEGPGVAAETLDRVVVALRHRLYAGKEQDENEDDQNRNYDVVARKRHKALLGRVTSPKVRNGANADRPAADPHPKRCRSAASHCWQTTRIAEGRVKGDLRRLQSALKECFQSAESNPTRKLAANQRLNHRHAIVAVVQAGYVAEIPAAGMAEYFGRLDGDLLKRFNAVR